MSGLSSDDPMFSGRVVTVHPNSMAAKKWRKSKWMTHYVPANDFAQAARAQKQHRDELARALRARGARAQQQQHFCG